MARLVRAIHASGPHRTTPQRTLSRWRAWAAMRTKPG